MPLQILRNFPQKKNHEKLHAIIADSVDTKSAACTQKGLSPNSFSCSHFTHISPQCTEQSSRTEAATPGNPPPPFHAAPTGGERQVHMVELTHPQKCIKKLVIPGV